MLFEGGFSFSNFLADLLAVFMFVLGSDYSWWSRATCSAAMTRSSTRSNGRLRARIVQ